VGFDGKGEIKRDLGFVMNYNGKQRLNKKD
jgi:hypothetical protein